MPPPPERCDGARHVRVVEVFAVSKPKHPPEADGHVRVSRKVKIDLEGEAEDAQPGRRCGENAEVGVQNASRRLPGEVGQQYFLAQPAEKPRHARRDALPGAVSFADLFGDFTIAHNGSGDELGKQGHKQEIIQKVALHRRLVAVYIQGVRHCLKGIERYADGQSQSDDGYLDSGQRPHRAEKEIGILEGEKKPQIEDHGGRYRQLGRPRAPMLGDDPGAGIVDQRGKNHRDHPERLAPGVEQQR